MIASWMLYIVLVSAVATIAAASSERVLRSARAPVRSLWLIAIFVPTLSAILSAGPWQAVQDRYSAVVTPSQSLEAPSPVRSVNAGTSYWLRKPITIVISDDYGLAKFDSILLVLWATGCIVTLAFFGVAAIRLRRIKLSATVRQVDGLRIFVTSSIGPLVFGLLRSEILIPSWVLELDRSKRKLVLAHEQEHLRARDPALLIVGVLGAGLTPWNPFSWYTLRRLHQAVEMDCDRRVLNEHPDMRAYAGLLLSVAGRGRTALLPLAGLAESVISLEQRLRSMTTPPTRGRRYRWATAIALAAMAVAATAMIPRPIRSAQTNKIAPVGHSPGRATGRARVVSASGFVTYKVYGTGGVFIPLGDSRGMSGDTLVKSVGGLTSAGNVFDLDVTNGAVHFVSQDTSSIHIEAAMSGDSPARWLSATGRHLVIDKGGSGVLAQAADSGMITFFEFQVDTPVIPRESTNPTYPAALKSHGIGGSVQVQYVVDQTGRIEMSSFKVLTSPNAELTAAVKAALVTWRFHPAIRRGQKVRQVVQQAFEFNAPNGAVN